MRGTGGGTEAVQCPSFAFPLYQLIRSGGRSDSAHKTVYQTVHWWES